MAAPPAFSADPLGMEGVEHWGWAGVWGKQTRPDFNSKRSVRLHNVSARQGGVGVKDACELAR